MTALSETEFTQNLVAVHPYTRLQHRVEIPKPLLQLIIIAMFNQVTCKPKALALKVCRGSYTPSFIGSMCRKEFSTNSASLCTVACTANHRGTSQTSVYQCPMSQQGSIFDPILGVSWWFRDAGSAHSVHGPSLWPARRFGTLYQTA